MTLVLNSSCDVAGTVGALTAQWCYKGWRTASDLPIDLYCLRYWVNGRPLLLLQQQQMCSYVLKYVDVHLAWLMGMHPAVAVATKQAI